MTDSMPAVAIPPRPQRHDMNVSEKAIDAILEDVRHWANEKGLANQKELKSTLVGCIDMNGYIFARNLEERHGWKPDALLVSILSGLSVARAHIQVVAAWVTYNAVNIPFSVGDRVSTHAIGGARVTKLCPGTAEVLVMPDEDFAEKFDHKGVFVATEELTLLFAAPTNSLEDAAPEGGAA